MNLKKKLIVVAFMASMASSSAVVGAMPHADVSAGKPSNTSPIGHPDAVTPERRSNTLVLLLAGLAALVFMAHRRTSQSAQENF